jgi:deoxycytidylate deaminase
MAESSNYGNFRHGAILVNGGRTISIGYNEDKYCSMAVPYRNKLKGIATYHAELSALVNLAPEAVRGGTMFVARAAKNTGELRMSKPCQMCHNFMSDYGLKQVYYTIDEEYIGTYKF